MKEAISCCNGRGIRCAMRQPSFCMMAAGCSDDARWIRRGRVLRGRRAGVASKSAAGAAMAGCVSEAGCAGDFRFSFFPHDVSEEDEERGPDLTVQETAIERVRADRPNFEPVRRRLSLASRLTLFLELGSRQGSSIIQKLTYRIYSQKCERRRAMVGALEGFCLAGTTYLLANNVPITGCQECSLPNMRKQMEPMTRTFVASGPPIFCQTRPPVLSY